MTDDELFLTTILQCSRSELFLRPAELTGEQKERLASMQQRRANNEPVQYICGFTEFMGYPVAVGPGVLVPRPETEVLVEAVVRELKANGQRECRALDIGTGSGCIPIALVKEVASCRVIGIDISEEALVFARRNAVLNGVAGQVEFIKQDMFWFLDAGNAGVGRSFDVIVSNPPYIPSALIAGLPADVRQEPVLALDGGPDGLHYYRYIIPAAQRFLRSGGWLALEFGDGQSKELENLFAITGGWDKIRFVKDNAGKSRIALARRAD
ncbi:MAG: peptide chain release factor N(5)-glutamine methyltransferase [Candidatus Omnitrophica bacterium]|nr:peptide chain release factor N(5)-glutamine methyltransferase [Candidatus Omnitrophota bacterium]